MRARLFCPVGELQLDHTFDTEVTVGRSPDNSLVVGHEVLSGHHLRVQWDGERSVYQLEDLQSSNGTRLDGERVREPQSLGHLHVITLADRFHLVFQDLERCTARHGGKAPPGARPLDADRTTVQPLPLPLPLPDVLRRPPGVEDSQTISEKTIFDRLPISIPGFLRKKDERQGRPKMETVDAALSPPDASPPSGEIPIVTQADWVLEVRGDDGVPRSFPLDEGEHVLGRGLEATLQILSPQVSRSHARLTVRGGKVRLRDLGSSNHTFVDGMRIEDEIDIEPGQQLAFGILEARLVWRGGSKATTRPEERA